MRNRFSQDVAVKLISNFGGEQEALDFLLNENEEDVRRFLKETPEYMEDIRKDSQNLASILKNGIDSSVRMFGCGGCTKTWWKRVPMRKEVSQCTRCKTRYDPIPRDKEWGWGKFICPCGNEFTSFAIMGETKSVCYKCGMECLVDHILPPRRRKPAGNGRTPHTCNGVNCYNRDDGGYGGSYSGNNSMYGSVQQLADQFGNSVALNQAPRGFSSAPGAYPGPAPVPTCIHPKSVTSPRRDLHYVSRQHRSTGSTVTEFMSQGSVDDATVASDIALCRIEEVNDC